MLIEPLYPHRPNLKEIVFEPYKSTITDVSNDRQEYIEVMTDRDGFVDKLILVIDVSGMEEITMDSITNYQPIYNVGSAYPTFTAMHKMFFVNRKRIMWALTRVFPMGCNIVGHTYNSMLQFVKNPTMQIPRLYESYLRDIGFDDSNVDFGIALLCNTKAIAKAFIELDDGFEDYSLTIKVIENLLGVKADCIGDDLMTQLLDEEDVEIHIESQISGKYEHMVQHYKLEYGMYLESDSEVPQRIVSQVAPGATGSFNIEGYRFEIICTVLKHGHRNSLLVGHVDDLHYIKTNNPYVNARLAKKYKAYDPRERAPFLALVTPDLINVVAANDDVDSVVVNNGVASLVMDTQLIGRLSQNSLSQYMPYHVGDVSVDIRNSMDLNPFYGKPKLFKLVGEDKHI